MVIGAGGCGLTNGASLIDILTTGLFSDSLFGVEIDSVFIDEVDDVDEVDVVSDDEDVGEDELGLYCFCDSGFSTVLLTEPFSPASQSPLCKLVVNEYVSGKTSA